MAKRTVWFKTPADAISSPIHFIAHVLTYGTHEDVVRLRKYISDSELVEAIENAPPGVFDPRSWAYWNLKIGRYPAPPMPQRTFEINSTKSTDNFSISTLNLSDQNANMPPNKH